MSKTSRYLKNLKYDQKFGNGLIASYLTNPRLVFLLVIFILVVGFTSLTSLSRTLNPEVDITYVSVSTVLPGAGPSEIESLITIPIEDAVESVDDLKSMQSTSRDNVSIVTLEFESGVDKDDVKRDVQALVDGVNDLPENANDPRVSTLDFENQPVLVFSLASETDVSSLITFSERLKDKLEDDSQIDRVSISGTEEQEIQILVKPSVANYYNVNPLLLASQIKSSISSFPAGLASSDRSNFPISINKTIEDIEDLRDMNLFLNGRVVRLGDIAEVSKKSKPTQLPSYLASNEKEAERAVVMAIYKTKSAKIDEVSNIAQGIIKDELSVYNGNFSYEVSQDVSKDIGDQFGDLGVNFMQTLILVFATLFIFLGIRQSLIVSLSIPLTFLISISVMYATGLSLNFLSVFSLLLALGLLVDDAIVITSAMTSYMRSKKFSPNEAGILVWKDFIVPIWSTTITTVWAFVPLLLSTGIVGEFIKTIPIVVSATLIASTSVAVLITLPSNMIAFSLNVPKRVKIAGKIIFSSLLVISYLALVPKDPIGLYILGFIIYMLFLFVTYSSRGEYQKLFSSYTKRVNSKKLKSSFEDGIIKSERITEWYQRKISKIIVSKELRKKTVTLVIVFSIFSYILLPLGLIKNEFFPKTDSDIVYMSLEMPSGTGFDVTKSEALFILDEIRKEDGVKLVLAEVGGLPPESSGQAGENTARFTLTLDSENSIEVAKRLREKYENISLGKIAVAEVSGGPPVGSDVQIKLLGDDLEVLNNMSDEIANFLDEKQGTINVSKSVTPSVSKLAFTPDESRLARYQISNDQLGLWARVSSSGFTLDTATIDDEEIDITYRLYDENLSLDSIDEIYVLTNQGPRKLSSLGEFALETNPTIITRENSKRTISISSGVEDGYSVPQISSELVAYVGEMGLPDGYEWQTGGANEENEDSVKSIMQAMILSAILILGTMVIQLGSYRKAIIVLLVIPLAISGVFVAFALTGTPLSFPSLIGVLALFGIVVNNSIVVIEKINQNLRSGIKFAESVTDAAASRVEPILFSSLTTILGLIPITLSDPLWRGLGGAIIAGLLVSGTIMLFFIPVVYYSWFREDYKVN